MCRGINEYREIKKSGLFNAFYYLKENGDVRRADIDPLMHFIKYGWKEGRNPSPNFDTEFYLRKYPDVKNAQVNPLLHYLKFGMTEGRIPTNSKEEIERPHNIEKKIKINRSRVQDFFKLLKNNPNLIYKFFRYLSHNGFRKTVNRVKLFLKNNFFLNIHSYKKILNSFPKTKDGIIFITHDANATGAPINMLNICKTYKESFSDNFVIISIANGNIWHEFQSINHAICLERPLNSIVIDNEIDNLFLYLYKLGYTKCIANTVISGVFVDILNRVGIEVIYLVHELPQTIMSLNCEKYARNIAESKSEVVFAANYVAEKFIHNYDLPRDFVHIIPQGIRSSLIYIGDKKEAKNKLIEFIGIKSELNTKIVLGAGYANYNKGTDLFFKVAEELYKGGKLEDIHFVWLGDRDASFEDWRNSVVPNLPYKNNIHFLDFQKEPAFIFAGADLFLLTSREDAFPSVALEALSNKTPLLMFKDTGGIEEIIDNDNGKVINRFDINEMSKETIQFLNGRDKKCSSILNLSSYSEYVNKLLSIFTETPKSFLQNHKVSVIVPNYNYENYLSTRLQSIIQQSYKPSEIIFLDDASSDNSINTAEKILSKSNIPYKILSNRKNEGVFKQWIKGIKESSNDYIWIAEADDVASLDFLLNVMKGFKDPDVNLSYCQSKQIDENSIINLDYSYLNYTNDLSKNKWLTNYTESGVFEVTNFLSIKNTIPNASAVVIKKAATLNLENHIYKYKYAGDWFAYIYILQKGKITYSSKILNYYRRHNKSIIVSKGISSVFFDEVRSIYDYIVDNFDVNSNIISRMEVNINSEKDSDFVNKENTQFFANLREKNRIKLQSKRILNILVILSEFNIGGGEITGLRLANYLSNNHNVYLYSAKEEENSNFMKMIKPRVHVISDEKSLRKLLHSGELDFINSHVWWGDKYAYSLVKENNIFWILSMHGCYEMLINNSSVDPDFPFLYKELLHRANYITYDSEKNLSIFDAYDMKHLLSKTKKIYHGYSTHDVSYNNVSRADFGFSNDCFIFTLMARGIKEKGWEEAINASIRLIKDGYNIGLLLIGDSSYIKELKKESSDFKFIKFLGEKFNAIDYLRISNCGLLPTYFISESQPLTIIEYLAAGLPVIATDIGEIKNMIKLDKYSAGYTIPLQSGKIDCNSLYLKMKDMVINSANYLELKKSTKIIFNNKFDINRFGQSYLSLYYDQEKR